MIPTWLVHTFAVIGFLNFAGLIAFVAWGCWRFAVEYRRALKAVRVLNVAIEESARLNEARMADEWVLREVAEEFVRDRARSRPGNGRRSA